MLRRAARDYGCSLLLIAQNIRLSGKRIGFYSCRVSEPERTKGMTFACPERPRLCVRCWSVP